jgi:hypothetical protein
MKKHSKKKNPKTHPAQKTIAETELLVGWLNQHIADKQKKRASYSMRSLAKRLAISPGHLSRILSGRRLLTKKVISKIFEIPELPEAFRKSNALGETLNPTPKGYQKTLVDSQEYLSQSRCLVASLLVDLRDFRVDWTWMSQQLNCTLSDAKNIWTQTVGLGLVEYNSKTNRWKKSDLPHFFVSPSKQDQTFAFNKIQCELAKDIASSTHSIAVDRKIAWFLGIASSPKKIKLARKRVVQMLDKLGTHLSEEPEKSTDLYQCLFVALPFRKQED